MLLPHENISYIQPVHEEQPSKNFYFSSTTGLPNPDEWSWRMDILERQVVEFGCCVGGITPDVMPTIFGSFWDLYLLDKLLYCMIFLKSLIRQWQVKLVMFLLLAYENEKPSGQYVGLICDESLTC
jgi:hypothetical protein